jgi:succinyl-diaminopimelate desuccinylase
MTDPLELLTALVAIPSVNPDLVPGAPGEPAIIHWCELWLRDRGFTTEVVQRRAGRPTLMAFLPELVTRDALLLNGHVDTVGVATYRGDPFTTRERDGRMYGRGTFDMKGGVAAILTAAARVAERTRAGDPPELSIVIALVADEEFGSVGTEDALGWAHDQKLRVAGAIVVEPSGLELTVAHRGFAWYRLDLVGRAAHGSQPEQGVDAIAAAAAVMAGLGKLERALRTNPTHDLLGHGTVRVATVDGGVDAATVAPSCRLTIERRTLPGDEAHEILRQLETTIGAAVASIPDLTWKLTQLVARGAYEAHPTSPVVRAVRGAVSERLGRPVAERGEPFWTDAGLMQEAGIDCLVFGVDGGGAHADEEWVDVESVRVVTDVLENVLYTYEGISVVSRQSSGVSGLTTGPC